MAEAIRRHTQHTHPAGASELDAPVADAFTDFKATGFTANWRSVEGQKHTSSTCSPMTTATENLMNTRCATIVWTELHSKSQDSIRRESTAIRCAPVARADFRKLSTSSAASVSPLRNSEKRPTSRTRRSTYRGYRPTTPISMKRAYTYDIRHRPPNATILSTRTSSTRPIRTSIPTRCPMGEAATVSLDEYLHRADWTGCMIGYAADCITLDNLMASSGIYGELDSPILDLSAGGGKVNIEMRARAPQCSLAQHFPYEIQCRQQMGLPR